MDKITQPKLYTQGKKLYVSFTLNGKRIRNSLGLDDNKRNRTIATNNIIPKIILEANEDKKDIPTVDESMAKSFELNKGTRSRAVQKDYIGAYNKHIKGIFGNVRLDKLKSSEVTLWQNSLINDKTNEPLAPKTIKKIRGLLHTMYEDAIDEEIVEVNPISKVKKIVDRRTEKREVFPFRKKEIQRILEHSNGQFKNIYALLFFSGMRIGEALALRHSDIDLEAKKISIKTSIRQGIIGTTKTYETRTIEIQNILMPYLVEQLKFTDKHKTFLFLNKNNDVYWDSDKIRGNDWKKTLKKADIKYRGLHQARHTFASTLIADGVNITYVSQYIGHKNTRITTETYSKYIPNDVLDFSSSFNIKAKSLA